MRGKCDNKEGNLNCALLFPRVSRYKKRSATLWRLGCILTRLYFTNKRLDLLASLRKCNYLYIQIKTTKQLAHLSISSIPSLKKIAQISSHPFFLAEATYFSLFSVFYHTLSFLPYRLVTLDPKP